MPKAKVLPIIAFDSPDCDDRNDDIMHSSAYQEPLQLTDKWQDDYGSGNRHDRRYWHARRAFLSSYHFSEQKDDSDNDSQYGSFKQKLRRSVRELNEAAMGIVLDIRQEMSKRKLGLRVMRIKFALPSFVMLRIRCFTPWLKKKELMMFNN